jgi:hypothetical protein
MSTIFQQQPPSVAKAGYLGFTDGARLFNGSAFDDLEILFFRAEAGGPNGYHLRSSLEFLR